MNFFVEKVNPLQAALFTDGGGGGRFKPLNHNIWLLKVTHKSVERNAIPTELFKAS